MNRQRRRRLPRPSRLSNWRLVHKLAVLLLIPLLAAAALGALRAGAKLDEARRFDALSEQIAAIPALFDFSYVVIAASTSISLGLPTIADQEQIVESTRNLELHADPEVLGAAIAGSIARLVDDGRALHESALGRSVSTKELERLTVDFLTRCEGVYRAVLDLAENTEVLTAGTDMLNAWTAQRTLLDQTNALGLLAANPEAALITAQSAMHVEESTLGLLRGTSLDNGRIDELFENLSLRQRQLAGMVSDGNPETELEGTMLAAFTPYKEMNNRAVEQITSTLDRLTSNSRAVAIRDAAVVAAILTIALVVALAVARALSVPLRRLRDGTLASAHHELPAAIEAVKNGADVDTVRLHPIDVHTSEEIGEVARAVDSMNSEALRLAGEQAHLRRQVAIMFETLARRNRTLVDQQLSLIESLEYQEKDPARLQSLFSLDHLAARIRRTGDSLLVLSDSRPQTRAAPTPLGDILRGAVSQVEDYQRVRIGRTPSGYLVGAAVTDVVHLLTELVDNALRASEAPSSVNFEFSAAVGGGLLLEIADSGVGIPPDALSEINARLTAGGDADVSAPRRMGLYVVGRLAARNGMSVRLRPTFDFDSNAGITASVYFPPELLVEVEHDTPTRMTERPRRLHLPDGWARHLDESETLR
ncbi:ATP-binding protein [Rhodococcus pyridinivorans]|uniref:sensor histidine kinase n=1 Tax=Rhodococcus TaxID=1827 RepID=UPI000903478C|nr:ATP-binding protein [Rhodococcus sp. 2G]APE10485.1 ATP-binding protein [Rhodococcus sp. 2G]